MADYREENRWYITASKIKLFIKSPELYKAVYVDEVDTSRLKQSPALVLWSMVDKYLLTPEEFDKEYMFPYWKWLKDDLIELCNRNWIELTWKEKVDELKMLAYWDKTVLTDAQQSIVMWISSETKRQPLWSWNPTKSEYKSQVTLYWKIHWLELKWTLDRFLYDPETKTAIIRDLKTTSWMHYNWYYNTTQFLADLMTKDPFEYKLQMAMYYYLVTSNYDCDNVCIIIDAVWTNDPYFYQAIMLDTEEISTTSTTRLFDFLTEMWEFESNWYKINSLKKWEFNRALLANNQYYRLDSEDCIQKWFDWVDSIDIPNTKVESESDFNWDDL